MDEHEFRRAVFLIVWRLLDANLREIPHVNTAVA